jgi:hypothetical protein
VCLRQRCNCHPKSTPPIRIAVNKDGVLTSLNLGWMGLSDFQRAGRMPFEAQGKPALPTQLAAHLVVEKLGHQIQRLARLWQLVVIPERVRQRFVDNQLRVVAGL